MVRKITITLLTSLGLLLILGPYFVRIPPLANIQSLDALRDDDSLVLRVSEVDIHYKMFTPTAEVELSSEAFVLLHGFGASLFTWREVTDDFSRRGLTVSYDRPAFGLTERPIEWQGENPYGSAAQVDYVVALMDHFEMKDAVLVGNSAGGRVAVEVALAMPDRIRALILVSPALSAGGPGLVSKLMAVPQINRLGPWFVRSISERGGELMTAAWHDPSGLTPSVITGYRKPLQAPNWDRALWEFTRAAGHRPEVVAPLKTTSFPILLITGDDDRVVSTQGTVEIASSLQAERQGVSLVVLQACGHVPQEECPADFMAAVNAFLDRLDAKP